MSKEFNIAIVGATGAVGSTMLSILQERHFPVGHIYAIAGERSAGSSILFNQKRFSVIRLADFDFAQADIALFSAGGHVSAEYVERAVLSGCIVIDNTSYFRYDPDVPLVIPEVNPHALKEFYKRRIIANPNCSTIQMMVALKPIYDAVGIQRINVATYQSVSGMGKRAVTALRNQTQAILDDQPSATEVFSKQIAFNVLPHIDAFQSNGYTKEEMKMVWETQKILEDKDILVNPTAVRVPVFYGHSEAVHIETRAKITAEEAKNLLKKAPGVKVIDDPNQTIYPTAAIDAEGADPVFVGRIREDISHPRGLDLWIVSDNIRKGAALNAVQIAELLIKDYL